MIWDRSSSSDSRHILQMYSERKICFKISKSETPRSAKCVRMYSVPTHCFPSQSGHWIWPIDREFISRTVTKTTNSAWNVDFRCHAKPCNSWHEWRSASNSSYMVPMMDFFSFGQPSWISSRSPITVPRFWMRGPPNSGTKNCLQNPMHFGNHFRIQRPGDFNLWSDCYFFQFWPTNGMIRTYHNQEYIRNWLILADCWYQKLFTARFTFRADFRSKCVSEWTRSGSAPEPTEGRKRSM